MTVETQHRDAPEVAATLATWAEGINRGDYSRSYALLTPGAQRRTPLAELIDGNDTTVLARITIESMTTAGEGVDDAVVTSTSEQAPEDGPDRQECTNWDMTYRMLLSDDGVWRIDQASNNPGSPAPC